MAEASLIENWAAMRTLIIAMLVLVAGSAGRTQSGAPAFEAASIKANPQRPPTSIAQIPGMIRALPGGRVEAAWAELRYMVFWAYGLEPYQVVEGKQPELSQHFDISAKAANPNATREDLQLMMRSLLKERFNLEAHVDTREADILVMVPARTDGKAGAGLTPFTDNCQQRNQNRAAFGSPQWRAAPPCTWTSMNDRAHGAGLTMSQLGRQFATYMEMPVVDRTGWPGEFEIDLEASMRDTPLLQRLRAPASLGAPLTQSTAPAFVEAVRDQLGIRLLKERGSIGTVVVDRVGPLLEN
jgi:uncharacterized protein (TIGR03435 family)